MFIRVIDFESSHDNPELGGLVEIGWTDLHCSRFDLLNEPMEWEIGDTKAKLKLARRLKIDGVSLAQRWPVILSYSVKRIFFFAHVTKVMQGDMTLFCSILTMEPTAVAAAAAEVSAEKFRQRIAECKKRSRAENLEAIVAAGGRIGRAYQHYAGNAA